MYYAGAKASVGEDVNRRLAGGDTTAHTNYEESYLTLFQFTPQYDVADAATACTTPETNCPLFSLECLCRRLFFFSGAADKV